MTPAHIAAAARIYTSRRARDLVFGADRDGFGEPAWDMLLTIVAANEATAMDDQMLIAASAVPADIARTYLTWLVSRQLLARTERKTFVLTERGRSLMLQYLDHEVQAKA